MGFSKYLDSKRKLLKELVLELRKEYKYVSILGSDSKSLRISADKRTSNITDGSDNDVGFVIKMSNGRGFFEYSLDDIDGDMKALAKKILDSLSINDELKDKMIVSREIKDEEFKKDFLRENDFDQYSAKDLLKSVIEVKDLLLKEEPNLLNATAVIMTQNINKIFVTEHKEMSQHYTWANGIVFVYYSEGEKMVSARDVVYSNQLKDIINDLPTKVKPVIEKAKHLVHAKAIVPGVYDVITDSSITGLIAHEAFGHGLEMDQFVKDRAVAKDYMGKYVASNITSMKDGAASTFSVASYFFDDDGVLAQDTQLIKDGILVGGMCDLVSASQLNAHATGNGRRQAHDHKAYTRMTNTFIEKGNDKLEDMIKSIKHGYMLFETNNGMEDPKNWAIQCVCEYGIEIIDGKLTDNYVSPVVMSGYVPDLLKSISMISDDFKIIGSGSCGKGYKEWVHVSDGGPCLKARVKLS